MANLMNYNFATLGQFYPEYQTDEIIKSHKKSDLFDFRFITSNEVYECINHLESSKPSGPNEKSSSLGNQRFCRKYQSISYPHIQ